jgi:hypothetical protein
MRYLFHKTEVQHIKNVQKAPDSGERNRIELLQTRRNYSVERLLSDTGLSQEEKLAQLVERALLLFEETYGARCNAMQVKMIRSLILDSSDDEAIDAVQARMGSGKTTLLPLMTIVQVAKEQSKEIKDKHLVRYVVPRAVIQDNLNSFHARLNAVLGANVVKDRDFSRYQIDEKEPTKSFELILGDLQERLAFYKQCIERGTVLIQWPEIRNSMEAQDLDFSEILTGGQLTLEQQALCLQCKLMLGQIRSMATYTVFDELDDTQDILSREVNFTLGAKKPISVETIIPLEKMLAFVANNNRDDLRTTAKEMTKEILGISNPSEELLDYLTDRTKRIADVSKSESGQLLREGSDSPVFLVRAFLIDSYIWDLAKSKQPNTHFGVRFVESGGQRRYFHDTESDSPLLIAVPYEGTNTPKGMSIFDNTEVAAIATMRYYASRETRFDSHPHITFLVQQAKKYNAIPADIVEGYNCSEVLDELNELASLLDARNLKQESEKFYKKHMENPTDEFRKFFGALVVATQIRTNEFCAKSDRYEKGSLDSIEKGCSGTVSGTSSYFVKQETDAAADGKISLEIMGRDNNSSVQILESPKPEEDYLKQVIKTLLGAANGKTRAIVDAAGICKSREGTPEAVVAELWKQLKEDDRFKNKIEGIVYYDQNGEKKLYRGPEKPAILCSTSMEELAAHDKKYFSFYGQKNTRGSDIKQANDTHALVTVDENNSNSDIKQAVLRFRNLVNSSSGQTFSFTVMPGFANIVKKACGIQDIDAKEVASYLRNKELKSTEHDALNIFRKEMAAHVKQAAFHLESKVFDELGHSLSKDQEGLYVNYLRERKNIVAFVEKSLTTLEEKYGRSETVCKREEFIENMKAECQRKLNLLLHCTNRFRSDLDQSLLDSRTLDPYEGCINHSIVFFRERFAVNTLVEVSTVNAGAQAVAQAQAQAKALAQAESQITLTENEIEVIDHEAHPKITLNMKHRKLDSEYSGIKPKEINDYSELKWLRNPFYRDKLLISDYLIQYKEHPYEQNLITHFCYLDYNKDKVTPVLIAQQEAEYHLKNYPKDWGNKIFDIRNLPKDHKDLPPEMCHMLQAAVHGDNNAKVLHEIKDFKELRKAILYNAQSADLLPELLISSKDKTLKYFDPTTFGLTKNIEIMLRAEISKDDVKLVFRGNGQVKQKTMEIPKTDKNLTDAIKKVYTDEKQPKKLSAVRNELNKTLNSFEKELEGISASIKDSVFPIFEISEGLNNSLDDLDSRRIVVEGVYYNKYQDLKFAYGAEFKLKVNKIQSARQKLITLVNNQATPGEIVVAFAVLQQRFYEIMSESTIKTAIAEGFDPKTSPLFSQENWKSSRVPDTRANTQGSSLSAMQPFEKLYGSSLYDAFKGKFNDLLSNSNKGHSELFSVTLPMIIDILKVMDPIQSKVKKLQEVAGSLVKSMTILEFMIDNQTEIEEELEKNGICFGGQGELFDRFSLQSFSDWESWNLSITGTMPKYINTVTGDMQVYKEGLLGLTDDEEEVLKDNRIAIDQVCTLAKAVINRSDFVKDRALSWKKQ